MFWLGLFIGFTAGVVALAIFRCGNSDECRECKAYYAAIIKERDDTIHGLKSTRGALGKKIQQMTNELQTNAMSKDLAKP
jgi:hypothetical protein